MLPTAVPNPVRDILSEFDDLERALRDVSVIATQAAPAYVMPERLFSLSERTRRLASKVGGQDLNRHRCEETRDSLLKLANEFERAQEVPVPTPPMLTQWVVKLGKTRKKYLDKTFSHMVCAIPLLRNVLTANTEGTCFAWDQVGSQRLAPDIRDAVSANMYELLEEVAHRYHGYEVSDEGDGKNLGFVGQDHERRAMLCALTFISNLDLLPERTKGAQPPRIRAACVSGKFVTRGGFAKITGDLIKIAKYLVDRREYCKPNLLVVSDAVRREAASVQEFPGLMMSRWVDLGGDYGRLHVSRPLTWGTPDRVHVDAEKRDRRRKTVRFYGAPECHCFLQLPTIARASVDNVSLAGIALRVDGRTSVKPGDTVDVWFHDFKGSAIALRKIKVLRADEVNKKPAGTDTIVAGSFENFLGEAELDQLITWE